jgi:hypothetical protein
MEIIGLSIVVVVGVVVIAIAGMGLAIAQYVWWAWWIYPAWAWFIVPIGAMPITLWHFIALTILLHGKPSKFEITDPHKTAKWTDWFGYAFGSIVGPMLVYWLLSRLHIHAQLATR